MNARFLALLFLAAGCKPPLHLQYDFGRAYVETLRLQADLTRPSVAGEGYFLYGPEGVMIRVNTSEATSEENDAKKTISATGGKL